MAKISASNSVKLSINASSSSTSKYTLTASFTENSTNTANNTSSITVTATITSANYSFDSGSTNNTLKIYWYDNNANKNGTLIATTNVNKMGANVTKTATGSITATHLSNGTLKGYAKAVWDKVDTNSYTPNDGNVSTANTNLTNIPRKSDLTVNMIRMNETINGISYGCPTYSLILITINRKLSSYTDTLSWTCGSLSETIQTQDANTKIALCFDDSAYNSSEIPSDYVKFRSSKTNVQLLNQMANNDGTYSANMVFTTTTYNGNTSLGSTSLTKSYEQLTSTIRAIASKETTDTLSNTLTGNNQTIIKSISEYKITISTTKFTNYQDSSTVSNYVFGDTTTTSNYYVFENFSSEDNVAIGIIDNRGYTNYRFVEPLTMVQYVMPKITNLTTSRAEPTSNNISVSINGYFWKGDFGTTNNAMTLKYRTKLDNDTYSAYTTVSSSSITIDNDGNFSYSTTMQGTYTKQFTVEFTLSDTANSSDVLTTIEPKGSSTFDIGSDFINVNGMLFENKQRVKTLDNTYPVGSVYISNTNTNPSSALGGGTWELIDKEFEPKNFSATDTDKWYTPNSTNTDSATCYASRAGHTITIEMTLVTKVALTDSTFDLIQFNIQKLGIASNKDLGNANISALVSDTNNGIVMAIWYNGGNVRSFDVIVRGSSTANLPSGANPRGSATWTVHANSMDDSACNKFFWKRTS